MPLEPLPLEPLFIERVWGGRGLAAAFRKDLPPDRPIGESWEAADIGEHVTRVAAGPFAGRSLRELVEEFGDRLHGGAVLPDGRLPLLFKLIDAREDLSVQLHPSDDEVPAGSQDRGKEEAWYVLAAEHGAKLVYGLRAGTTKDAFLRAIAAGGAEGALSWHPDRPGDVYYVPPGTVHAIGKGIVLAEIQQSSDTTYRLYDWGRVGLDGKPRRLHIEEASGVAWAPPATCPSEPVRLAAGPGEPDILVAGKHFRFLRYRLRARAAAASGTLAHRFALLFTVEGEASLIADAGVWTLAAGVTWLLPAATAAWRIEARADAWTGLWMEPGAGGCLAKAPGPR